MTLDLIWTHVPSPLKAIFVLLFATVIAPLMGVLMFLSMILFSWFVPYRFRADRYYRTRRMDTLVFVARTYTVILGLLLVLMVFR